MITQSKSLSLWLLGLISLFSFVLTGCGGAASKGRASTAKMDTPQYHNESGEYKLAQGDFDDAKRSFQKALELAPKSSLPRQA